MSMRAFPILFLVLFLVNCAHHRDVRTGSKGIHTVIIPAERGDGAYRDARRQAEHFCEQFGKAPIILKEKTKYTGKEDEDTYNKAKSASKAARTVGGMAFVFGSGAVEGAGGAVALAGMGGDAYLGDGYRYTMRFRCAKDIDL